MKKLHLLSVVVVLWFAMTHAGFAQAEPSARHLAMVDFLMDYLRIKYPNEQFDDFLYVAARRQVMFHIRNKEVQHIYVISTAKNGLGNLAGSNQTPEGLHRICEKVGSEVPLGGVIKAKQFTGAVASIEKSAVPVGTDQLTTRAMHLIGLEDGLNKGLNVDSYERGIFIHGTPEEGLLGQQASKGCVRMSNIDILGLFDRVGVGTYVLILNN